MCKSAVSVYKGGGGMNSSIWSIVVKLPETESVKLRFLNCAGQLPMADELDSLLKQFPDGTIITEMRRSFNQFKK